MTNISFKLKLTELDLSDLKKGDELVIASTAAPGATSLITSPSELKPAFTRIRNGVLGHDLGLALKGAASLTSHTCSIIYSFFTLGAYFSTGVSVASFVFKDLAENLSKVAAVSRAVFEHPAIAATTLGLGALISIINGTFELLGLNNQVQFRRHFKFSEEITDANAKEKFAALDKYLDLNPSQKTALATLGSKEFESASTAPSLNTEKSTELKSLMNDINVQKLSELIAPRLAREITSEFATMETKLSTQEERQAVEWLKGIYERMDIQSKKALIVHSLGLAAIVTSLLTTALSFVVFPGALIVFALLVALSLAFTIARYVVHAGYFNSEGWVFEPLNLIPVFLREMGQKVIKATYETKNLAYSSSSFIGPFGCSAGSTVPP